jgi:hypothetical protein
LTNGQAYLILCRCLAAYLASQDRPEPLRRRLAAPDMDWVALVAAADREYLLPALHCALRDCRLLDLAPAPAAEVLTGLHALNLIRNREIEGLLPGLCAGLASSGTPAVLLKGAANLISGVYREPGLMILGDLDILVSPQALAPALANLERDGWQAGSVVWENQYHVDPRIHPEHCVELEIHYALVPRCLQTVLPTAQVLAQATACPGPTSTLYIPSPEHQVLHCLLEAGWAHGERFRLRKLVALVLLCQKYGDSLDWRLIREVLARPGLGELRRRHLLWAEVLLGQRLEPLAPALPPLTPPRAAEALGRLVAPLHAGRVPLAPALGAMWSQWLALFQPPWAGLNGPPRLEASLRWSCRIARMATLLLELLPPGSPPRELYALIHERIVGVLAVTPWQRRVLLTGLFSPGWYSLKIRGLAKLWRKRSSPA